MGNFPIKPSNTPKVSHAAKPRLARGSCGFSEPAALEIIDYFASSCKYLKESETIMISVLSIGEGNLLEQCFMALGATAQTIEPCGHLSSTLIRSALPIAQKLKSEGIKFVGCETVPTPPKLRYKNEGRTPSER